jgi:ABC-type branched-subunit amino acid transport system permease subunit
MTTTVAALHLQTVVDGIGIGAIYALMAVGIGLVFGVLRLVNFAYGQLIMAGAFALAMASEWDWPAPLCHDDRCRSHRPSGLSDAPDVWDWESCWGRRRGTVWCFHSWAMTVSIM